VGIFTYLKLGLVAALVIGVAYFAWSYQGMKIKLQEEKTMREVAEAKVVVAEKTIKIFREWENIDEVMENAGDDDVIDYLRTGVWPQDRSKAGDRPAPVPGPAETGKPGEGQKR
jgi:hypothetical protein